MLCRDANTLKSKVKKSVNDGLQQPDKKTSELHRTDKEMATPYPFPR